jgi:hypothetical protein
MVNLLGSRRTTSREIDILPLLRRAAVLEILWFQIHPPAAHRALASVVSGGATTTFAAKVTELESLGRWVRSGSRQRQAKGTRWEGPFFERAADSRAQDTFDLISKNVVPHAEVIAPPFDDTRPSQAAEKVTARRPLLAPVTRRATIPAKDRRNH